MIRSATASGGRSVATVGEQSVHIELLVADGDEERPDVESGSRVDVSVAGEMYPTARLADGRYIAWWFDTSAPDPTDQAATEWVAAPTRYLAAATLRELWEDPSLFDTLTQGSTPASP
ncbi:hypothetical protein SAMN04487949_3616 [Halogranum gelatinilyticum]|uniref:Uncharacterized protein n=1 Tax=Halogranum gelatinilyticum TaxID=660521 RepID=A0A1G9ZFV3_9EURY|nr:hypothetical protein SAMN04487949_3616 [Halogranum gelatinilyticum]